MRTIAKSNKGLALLFSIFLIVFSTGIVIAHQCKSMSSDQVAMQHQHSGTESGSNFVAKSLNVAPITGRLIDSGCAALFIVLLLLGRKLLDLRAPRSRLDSFMNLGREWVSVCRPQVFHLALTRPQLGIIRI